MCAVASSTIATDQSARALDASIAIADCNRIVSLDFSVDYEKDGVKRAKMRKQAKAKIGRLIQQLYLIDVAIDENEDKNVTIGAE